MTGHPNDPDAPTRQETYLRALRTLSNIEIILGHFLTHEVYLPLAGSSPDRPRFAKVLKTEEKGSDVNIATHLLNDAYKRRFDAAALVSNDSDLQEPVRIVSHELKLPIGVINPQRPTLIVRQGRQPVRSRQRSRQLVRYATFRKVIRKGLLAVSQFPDTLQDAKGSFFKPGDW